MFKIIFLGIILSLLNTAHAIEFFSACTRHQTSNTKPPELIETHPESKTLRRSGDPLNEIKEG